MANRDFIVFDFETGSRNPLKTQPTQIAAIARLLSTEASDGYIFPKPWDVLKLP